MIDAPTALQEGTLLDLVLDDEGDDLDATQRRTQPFFELGNEPKRAKVARPPT